ncbi:hypothetical protein SBOR_7450 [Sclerotinia borealis F-4128]|uniref:DUF7918 domain-containing protein n=1 Tax=Sclerotinia borealis (strain F-4128) TaxID=1432307 RepID=W9CC60_SCLBF|nr:hypothetical protein SBOR_7450 [Sclerotinia borealis F-4128]
MAISDLLPGVEATVLVDGVPLVEYENNDIKNEADEPEVKKLLASKTISKYIEAVNDKNFSVNITVDEGHKSHYASNTYCLIMRIYIDGCYVKGCNSSLFKTGLWKVRTNGLYSGENGQEFFKAFTFSKLTISEDEMALSKALDDAQLVKGLGEIIVSFHRGKITGSHITVGGPSPKSTDMNTATGEELHVKAVTIGQEFQSHGTTLAPPQPCSVSLGGTKYNTATYIGGLDQSCIGRFSFKYRSREILKSFLIVDRTPEGTPDPIDFQTMSSRPSSTPIATSTPPTTPELSIIGPRTVPKSHTSHPKIEPGDHPSAPTTPPNTRTYALRQKNIAKREAEDHKDETLSPQKRARARKDKVKVEVV